MNHSNQRTPFVLRFTVSYTLLLIGFATTVMADSDGTAVIRAGDTEYTIPVNCKDAQKPEMGVFTEPARITREKTGRSSGVRLNIRPWKETTDMIVSLDRYVAWLPLQSSSAGKFELEIDMSPASIMRNNVPAALTYDLWLAGERPEGLKNVWMQVDCNYRDPDAPKSQKL